MSQQQSAAEMPQQQGKATTQLNKTHFADIAMQSKDELDMYGDYKAKYPQKNWSIEGPRDIHFYKPVHESMLQKANYNFSMDLGAERDRFRFLLNSSIAVSTAAVLAYKHPITKYALVPISALWCLTLYHYDLGYGNMVNRIQIEAHGLVKER